MQGKNESFTKRGPGRKHKQGDGTHAHLTLKQKQAGAFAAGLTARRTNAPSKGRV